MNRAGPGPHVGHPERDLSSSLPEGCSDERPTAQDTCCVLMCQTTPKNHPSLGTHPCLKQLKEPQTDICISLFIKVLIIVKSGKGARVSFAY